MIMEPVKFRTIFNWIKAGTSDQEWMNIPMQRKGRSINVKTFADVILCKNAVTGTEYVLDGTKYKMAFEKMKSLREPERWQPKRYVRPYWLVPENHCAPTAMIICRCYCEQHNNLPKR